MSQTSEDKLKCDWVVKVFKPQDKSDWTRHGTLRLKNKTKDEALSIAQSFRDKYYPGGETVIISGSDL